MRAIAGRIEGCGQRPGGVGRRGQAEGAAHPNDVLQLAREAALQLAVEVRVPDAGCRQLSRANPQVEIFERNRVTTHRHSRRRRQRERNGAEVRGQILQIDERGSAFVVGQAPGGQRAAVERAKHSARFGANERSQGFEVHLAEHGHRLVFVG